MRERKLRKRKGYIPSRLSSRGEVARILARIYAFGGSAEIDAYEIGLAILGPLRELDEVAYLRFASVYQAFDSLEDFEAAITVLRAERDSEHDPQDDDRADGETMPAAEDVPTT